MCVCVDYGLDVHFLAHLQSIRCFGWAMVENSTLEKRDSRHSR